MTIQNYKQTITVNNTPRAAFDALTTGIEHWWTRPDTPICKKGDLARFTFPPGKSYWTFKAMHLRIQHSAAKAPPTKRSKTHAKLSI